MRQDNAEEMIRRELAAADEKFGRFHSAHEGYAVILEEMDELWLSIKQPPHAYDGERVRKEAIQVAAMTLRFLVDLL